MYTYPVSSPFPDPMSLWCSLTLAKVLPDVYTFLSPPVSEACADCLTAGAPGPLSCLLCPALCPLQLAVPALCSPRRRLRTQAAGVPAKSLPSSQPTLPLTSLERTHFFPLHLVFFMFSSISSPLIHPPTHAAQLKQKQLKKL